VENPGEASVCGRRAESEAERGEKRLAKRSRSATPPPSRRRKAAADAASPLPLVTSARFCGVERAWLRGGQGQPEARGARKGALVTAEAGVKPHDGVAVNLSYALNAADAVSFAKQPYPLHLVFNL